MAASEARIRANRENARRSTGPTSQAGKDRVRRNALKHGLTGQGVALPTEDQAEVTRLFIALQKDLRPSNDLSEKLVRRVAYLSVRLERCEKHDTTETAQRVRHAIARFDDERLAAVEALVAKLYVEPATTVRRLQMTPEGIDRLLDGWEVLRDDLNVEGGKRWTSNHRSHFDILIGRDPGGYRVARIMALSEALSGFFHHLDRADGEGLDGPARSEWARGELTRIIDVEMARLKGARVRLDPGAIAADRDEAVDRALFDPSKEAILARKYEAATERALYKALKEFRQAEAEAAEGQESDVIVETDETCDPLALNGSEPEEEAGEDEAGPSETSTGVEPTILPLPERATEGPNPVERATIGPA